MSFKMDIWKSSPQDCDHTNGRIYTKIGHKQAMTSPQIPLFYFLKIRIFCPFFSRKTPFLGLRRRHVLWDRAYRPQKSSDFYQIWYKVASAECPGCPSRIFLYSHFQAFFVCFFTFFGRFWGFSVIWDVHLVGCLQVLELSKEVNF